MVIGLLSDERVRLAFLSRPNLVEELDPPERIVLVRSLFTGLVSSIDTEVVTGITAMFRETVARAELEPTDIRAELLKAEKAIRSANSTSSKLTKARIQNVLFPNLVGYLPPTAETLNAVDTAFTRSINIIRLPSEHREAAAHLAGFTEALRARIPQQ